MRQLVVELRSHAASELGTPELKRDRAEVSEIPLGCDEFALTIIPDHDEEGAVVALTHVAKNASSLPAIDCST